MAERIHGPYKHRARWRVVGVDASGARIRCSFASEQEARAFLEAARCALGHRTVGQAVSAYLEHLVTAGRRASTITTARYRLVAFLRLTEGEALLGALTVARARDLYARRVAEVKADTHRGELALASTFAAWCVRQGWLASDPFADVEPVGAKAHGKDQLRLDEARRFLALALEEDTPAGLACALALLTGARASEVTDRVVRDLDDGGRLLWITRSKTSAGVRRVAIPEALRARMLALVAGKAPDERIWGDVTRHWLGHHVRRLCAAAGVPVVSPHGLRGVAATLLHQHAGQAVEQVAQILGQAGPGVTRRHYLAPGAEGEALSREIAERLTGQK